MDRLTRITEAYELMLSALRKFEEDKNISIDLQINNANLNRWRFYKAVWFTTNKNRDYGCVYFSYHQYSKKPCIELSPATKLIKDKILEVLGDYKDLIC